MPLLFARMSHARLLSWLTISCVACCPTGAKLFGQNGPAVQIFTSTTSGQARLMPLERLPVSISLSVSAGYDTNVGTSSLNEQDSFYSTASLNLTYGFGTPRTRARLAWGAGVTYFSSGDRGGFQYDPNTALQFSLAHDVSERLTLNAGVYVKYGVEPDFFSGVGENRRSGNFFYSSDSLSATYQWLERFSTVSSYSIAILKYEEDVLGTFLNRYEQGFSQQFRFLFLPITTVVSEYRLALATYDTADRDSTSQFFLAGVDQTIGPHVQGSIRAGAQLRSSDQENSNTLSPYVSGNLGCVIGEKTSLNLTAQYSTDESNIIEATSRTSFSTGLQLSYSITPRISSSVSCYYRHDVDRQPPTLFFSPQARTFFVAQPSFSEDTLDLGLNFSYAINPRLSATAGFHYTEVNSELSSRPYSRARYSGAITYAF